MLKRAALVLLVRLLPCCAQANDTSAALETGGLRFKQDPDIMMRSEDLFISEKQIRIVYRFFNTSAADKTIMIAFPMPDIVGTAADENIGIPTDDPENIFDFHVAVDGKAASPHLEQTALANGVDQTALLRKLGIPLMPIRGPAGELLDRVPKSTLARAGQARRWSHRDLRQRRSDAGSPGADLDVALGLYLDADLPRGPRAHLRADLSSERRRLRADHHRRRQLAHQSGSEELAGVVLRRRRSDPFDRARTCGEARSLSPFGERSIAYVPSTGANWAAPIGDFHLTIDKGEPGNFVSFCADGVRKTGPTRFEVRHTNFTPSRDLKIVIFVPNPN